jgi:hypothetical protein
VAKRSHAVEEGVRADVPDPRELAAGIHHGFRAPDGRRQRARRLAGVGGRALAFEHFECGFEHGQVGREGLEAIAALAGDDGQNDSPEIAVQATTLTQRRRQARADLGRLHRAAAAQARGVALLPATFGEELVEVIARPDAEPADLTAGLGPALAQEAVARVAAEVRGALHEPEPAALPRPVLAHGQLVSHGDQGISRPGGSRGPGNQRDENAAQHGSTNQ